jgi:hypothetical protein
MYLSVVRRGLFGDFVKETRKTHSSFHERTKATCGVKNAEKICR